MKTVLIALSLLIAAPAALAQVTVVSAVWNQSLESVKIEGSIDPAIEAIAIEVHATHPAHHSLPDPTVDSVQLWRATVDDYYSYNSRYEGLLDGSTQLNVNVPIKWDPISVNKVVIKEHHPSTAVLDEYIDVSIICPTQGDFSLGAPTTTDCMPETDRQVFLGEEFFDSQGTSVRRLIEPAEWCRLDLAQQRLYWPREGGADCSVWPQAQIDMSTAANTSRQYWEGLGCGNWYKSHTVNFEVDFTEIQLIIRGEAFASLDSPLDEGHIFINSDLAQSGADDAAGAVLHELTHAAIEFSILPSAIANKWAAERIWPEAIATAAMIDNQPGSNHFVGLHGPWPKMWRDGLKYGSNKARHAALLILYLNENQGFNSCQFMLDQHALLLEGDEIGAFEAEVPNFRRWFSRFVANYNMRTGIVGIDLLPPHTPFPIALPVENDILGVANGMRDGDTMRVLFPGFFGGFSLGLEASPRCEPYNTVVHIHEDGLAPIQYTLPTGQYTPTGSWLWSHNNDFLVTVASPEGTTHMRELVFTNWNRPNIPNDPWPAQDLNDPFPSGCE